ncbi:MAG: hypothetical protein U0T69_11910 [Chitinophagales bacterium]
MSLALESHNEDSFLANTVSSYEKILNETAKDGWEFVKADTIQPLSQEDNLHPKSVAFTKSGITKILIFKKYASDVNDNQQELNFVFNEPLLTCPSCRNEISADDIYCQNCAHKLK